MTDIAIQAREIIRMQEGIGALIAKGTSQTLGKAMADIDRDFWMSAPEAIEYVLVSKSIVNAKEVA